MKRTALILIVLCFASSLYAGGKACEAAAKAKSVELTGTLIPAAGGGDDAKATFRVANSNQTYTVCEQTKSSVLKLANQGALWVKGKVVTCGGHEELVISEAKKL